MDPNQNTPPNYKNRKPDNDFTLDTTPRQFPTMESPQGGFLNLLQTGSPIQQTPLFQQQYQHFLSFQQQMSQQNQQFQQFQQLQQLQQQSSQQQQPLISQPPLLPDFVAETQPSPPPQPKKKKGKKNDPTHYHPRKGSIVKIRRRKVSGGMGGGFPRSNCRR
uniref:Uncharacterized protein n=1 Tax=Lactuca sativa TaxID=4236 RepID=A0A9R1V0M9_LACSA|nr:hypothetical protein LSAT_V11C700375360 [Lactuca sativa]